jgi:hypothetical protein
VELLQDVPDVHFDGAFLHSELGGDQLVGLALAQEIDYCPLTRGQVQLIRSPPPFALGFAIVRCSCRAQSDRWNEGPTRADQPERGENNFAFNRSGYIAPHAVGQSHVDLADIVPIREDNRRRIWQPNREKLKRTPYPLVSESGTPYVKDNKI